MVNKALINDVIYFQIVKVKDNHIFYLSINSYKRDYCLFMFTEEEGKLHLAWQESDCLRVISGENSEVYTISKIISDHEAEFTGNAVSGTAFDILFPGTYASVEEAEADVTTPTQTSNGSAAHLRYKALLSGVDSYANIAFKSDFVISG